MLLFVIASTLLSACKFQYTPKLSSNEGINFKVTSLNTAQLEAKQEKRPLFLFAHASWCPTCKEMERVVLVRKELGDAYNKNIVNDAIDIDSLNGKELQKKYPIHATPTLFFFNANGSLAKKVEGAATVPELLAIEKQVTGNSSI